jgi:hypothetical protein
VFIEEKVQFLTFLDVTVKKYKNNSLLLIEVEGFSKLEQPGVPALVPVIKKGNDNHDGILEYDFVILKTGNLKEGNLSWGLRLVCETNKLPGNLKGIRVNAEENADICLI